MKQIAPKSLLNTVVTLYLAVTALFAGGFIVSHVQHDHDQNGAEGSCLVCYQVEQACLLLEALWRSSSIAAAAAVSFYVKKYIYKLLPAFCHIPTLVSLKIRLNP